MKRNACTYVHICRGPYYCPTVQLLLRAAVTSRMAELNPVLDIVTSYSGPKTNFIHLNANGLSCAPKGVDEDRPDGRRNVLSDESLTILPVQYGTCKIHPSRFPASAAGKFFDVAAGSPAQPRRGNGTDQDPSFISSLISKAGRPFVSFRLMGAREATRELPTTTSTGAGRGVVLVG